MIGAPFLAKGDDPSGWDCRGLARWCLAEWCGVRTPDYRPLYEAAIVDRPWGRRERARLIAEGLASWREVPPQPGVLAWLEWLGGAGHVGFMLTPRLVLHADAGVDTTVLDLDQQPCRYRLKGCFVPENILRIEVLAGAFVGPSGPPDPTPRRGPAS